MPSIKSIIVLLFLLAASSDARYLRGSNSSKQRDLQVTSFVLNALIEYFQPQLEGIVKGVILEKDKDPFDLARGVQLGAIEFPLPAGSCQNSSSASYGLLGTISGLSDFQINTLELIPGSGNVKFEGFGRGATWSGIWRLNVTFANITAETTASLQTESCLGEDPMEQQFISNRSFADGIAVPNFPSNGDWTTGTSSLLDTSFEYRVTLGGETSNLLRIPQSSQVNTVQLEGLDVALGSVATGFDMKNTIIPASDLGNSFNSFFIDKYSGALEPQLIDKANKALSTLDILPIEL